MISLYIVKFITPLSDATLTGSHMSHLWRLGSFRGASFISPASSRAQRGQPLFVYLEGAMYTSGIQLNSYCS